MNDLKNDQADPKQRSSSRLGGANPKVIGLVLGLAAAVPLLFMVNDHLRYRELQRIVTLMEEGRHEEAIRVLGRRGSYDPDVITRCLIGSTRLHQRFLDHALVLAASFDHRNIIRHLLEAGADIVAALNGRIGTVRLLIERGADIGVIDSSDTSPLFVAALRGHADVVADLLDAGADPRRRSLNDMTPLGVAAQKGNVAVVQQLLGQGVGVNEVALGHEELAALMIAVVWGQEATVKILIENGAQLDAKSKDGAPALSVAAHSGHLPVVKVLLERGASVDETNDQGGTALRSAADGGYLGIVRLLLKRRADPDTEDIFGKLPIDYARENGHHEIVELLTQY